MFEGINEYERAFEGYLADNRIDCSAVDQARRGFFNGQKVKTFDFIVYQAGIDRAILAEVKGKKFKGTSLAGMKGFQCWVGIDDVAGLSQWEKMLSDQSCGSVEGLFVFVYEFENIDVENDGLDVYEFQGRQYLFYCVKLSDYARAMKVRSRSWQTVTLAADKFRELAIPLDKVLCGCKD
ncbi:MAG: hypothetical protein FVQ79_03190 [Planctomycetes bacterium]|nr:hypothetical protein [Planctomycetota bacterium]